MPTQELVIPKKKKRIFLEDNIDVSKWENLEPYFENLVTRPISNLDDLYNWILDKSELEAVLQEYSAQIMIRMTCNTEDEEANKLYEHFFGVLEPKFQKYENDLNIKFNDCPYKNELDPKLFEVHNKIIATKLAIFRKENIELKSQINLKTAEYGKIAGAMTLNVDGEEITLQKASLLLKNKDRSLRESIFHKIWERRQKEEDKLNQLFSDLLKLRHKIAINAGYDNYRDYMFQDLGRFDYTADDCFAFHDSIEKNILPLVEQIMTHRKEQLQVSVLKPWDTTVDIAGDPLKAFTNSDDLIEKSIKCFEKVHPYFAKCIETMRENNKLDLESRKGKAPGGYMTPMYESLVPFIFMNGVGSMKDMITMLHEGGHAFHEFLTAKYDVMGFKSYPSEIAELASMSMELMTIDSWNEFFKSENELRRAKKEHLEDILLMLPWIALIDAYQHWIYTNPYHSVEERGRKWSELCQRFTPKCVDWTGQEHFFKFQWQRQLHLFEVPFYYIEYGMAQLGAVAMYMSYKQDKDKTIENYINALSLGYTKSIPNVYQAAGIKFDFSNQYIQDLAGFINHELTSLN